MNLYHMMYMAHLKYIYIIVIIVILIPSLHNEHFSLNGSVNNEMTLIHYHNNLTINKLLTLLINS